MGSRGRVSGRPTITPLSLWERVRVRASVCGRGAGGEGTPLARTGSLGQWGRLPTCPERLRVRDVAAGWQPAPRPPRRNASPRARGTPRCGPAAACSKPWHTTLDARRQTGAPARLSLCRSLATCKSRSEVARLVPVCSRAVHRTTSRLKALGKLFSLLRAAVHSDGVASEKIADLP
jgi:hypothetical protein